MTLLDVIALGLGLLAALTLWGVGLTIRHQMKIGGVKDTPGARLVQALHLYWGFSVALLAFAVVYG